MIEVKRFSGVLNTDDKVQDVLSTQHIDAKNIRFTGGQNGLTAENIKGNYVIQNDDLPAGDNYCIGAFFDQLNQVIIWFNFNDLGNHGIYQIDIPTEVITPIFICGIQSAGDILNFDRNYPVHSVQIVYRDGGNFLFWTDGYNRPRYLNIDPASIAALAPFTEEMINAAKQPPLKPILPNYSSRPGVYYNNVYNKYFRFAYRWVYVNGEKSTFSPTSICPIPSAINPQSPIQPNSNNFIFLNNIFSPDTEDFKAIEVYGQQYNGATWEDFFLITTLERDPTPLPYTTTFDFFNDDTYLPILPEESDLRFDRLPDIANTLELLNGNVIIYGGITEGYDLIERQDVDVQVTASLSLSANSYSVVSPVWRWGQNERFGLVYFDQYGKTNGVVSYLNNATSPNPDNTNFDVTTGQYPGQAGPGIGISTPRISASINHLPPTWAKTYQWVRQDIAPTFFLEYVTSQWDSSDPNFDYLCIESLFYNNTQGFVPAYDFTKGDRVRIMGNFTANDTVTAFGVIHDFEILEVVQKSMTTPPRLGPWLKINKLGGGPPYTNNMLIEIYTPNLINRSEVVFYEWGEQYGIYEIAGVKYHLGDTQNQTASQPALFVWDNGPFYVKKRSFPLTASINIGFCAVIDRNYNDFTPSKANNNSRQWIIEEDSKREYLSTSVRWGGAYLQDSNTNELNRYYPGAIDTIDRAKGDIRRMKARDRILRVFQDRGVGQYGVFTRYIQNSSGGGELVTTNEIITANNIQYYAGNYGLCGYPTNLVSSQKSDYFTDVITGRSIRLGQDGITDLGLAYKGQFFLSSLVTPYNTTLLNEDNVKAKVMGFYDFYDDQYHVVLEASVDTDPKNYSFNERRNAFCSFYDYHPEWAIGANDMIYTWLDGRIYKHDNTTQYCTFYGNIQDASVTVVMNGNLLTKKTWNSINEIASVAWEVPTMYTNSYSYGTQVQQSNLGVGEFTLLEGNPSTAIKRDINSPAGKINGNYMKGNYLVLKLQRSAATNLVTLSEISVRFTESPLTAK